MVMHAQMQETKKPKASSRYQGKPTTTQQKSKANYTTEHLEPKAHNCRVIWWVGGSALYYLSDSLLIVLHSQPAEKTRM